MPVVTRAGGMLLGCVAVAIAATMAGRSRWPVGICHNRFPAPSGATLWWRLDRSARSSSSSPVVVLTGDVGAGADVWAEAAQQICGAGLDVLTYDRPGLGASRSARGRGAHSTLVHATDLAALLEEATPGRSILIAGVGFGATVGVLAASLSKRPAVAVVMDPSGLPALAPVSRVHRVDLRDRSIDARLTSVSLWLGGAAVRVPPQADGADAKRAFAVVRADRDPRLWGTLSREFSAAARFDPERTVHEGIPTTVLASRAFAARERETLKKWRRCSVLHITEPSWLSRSSAPMSAAVVSEFVRCIIGASE